MEITTTRTPRRSRVRLAGNVIALGLPDRQRRSTDTEPGSPSLLGVTGIASKARHRSSRAAHLVVSSDSSEEGRVPLRPAADTVTRLSEDAPAS